VGRPPLKKSGAMTNAERLRRHRRKVAKDKKLANPKLKAKRERRAERERQLGARQLAYPTNLYGLIVADDEWDHEVWSRETGMDRHAANRYSTAADAHTAAEMHERTKERFTPAPDCLLAMWTTNQHLAIAIDLMRLRGFHYVSNYAWGKDKFGLGYWSREKHELLLLGVRGQIPCPAPGLQLDSLIMAPRGAHSAKPECFLEMLERYFPSLPKIELNRRGKPRPGWDAWGAEAEND
jgi:N6-adenosine-specific RNA methylase IME4